MSNGAGHRRKRHDFRQHPGHAGLQEHPAVYGKPENETCLDAEHDIQCCYEAGCFGYSLCNQLKAAGVKCVILAPTTMLTPQGQHVKIDAQDALMIAQCLSYGGYYAVYIPTDYKNIVNCSEM